MLDIVHYFTHHMIVILQNKFVMDVEGGTLTEVMLCDIKHLNQRTQQTIQASKSSNISTETHLQDVCK